MTEDVKTVDLTKKYKDMTAVGGLRLSVKKRESFSARRERRDHSFLRQMKKAETK